MLSPSMGEEQEVELTSLSSSSNLSTWRVCLVVSHFNSRIFVNRYEIPASSSSSSSPLRDLLLGIETYGKEKKVTKICMKLREDDLLKHFSSASSFEVGLETETRYRIEARIPDYFRDGVTACYVVRYLDSRRGDRRAIILPPTISSFSDSTSSSSLLEEGEVEEEDRSLNQLFETVSSNSSSPIPQQLAEGYISEVLFLPHHDEATRTEQVNRLSHLFNQVFETYPYPIGDPNYLLSAVPASSPSSYNSSTKPLTVYRVIKDERTGEYVAAVAAEMNMLELCAEITDFATLPQVRGKGFASFLLHSIERDITTSPSSSFLTFGFEFGIKTLYSIARSSSSSMLSVLIRHGYTHLGGTLINNCVIGNKRMETLRVLIKNKQLP
jgi:putative beta-lysine N-acetyltransferase